MTLEFQNIDVEGYEEVVRIKEKSVGLDALIAIHNTKMGPALGGTRIFPYADVDDALFDVLRLSKGMTYKSALAEVGFGGGKSVIIADPKMHKTKELLRAFGRAIHKLGGRYIAAEDSGCTPEDMMEIAKETPYVVGLPSGTGSGDPSPFTAWGTFRGIQATLNALYNDPSPNGRVIAIQGLGHVGYKVGELLFWAGAHLIVSDIDEEKAKKFALAFGAKVVSSEDILSTPCDVFSPCAFGGVIKRESILRLRCRAVAGCANNQLLDPQDGESLQEMDILYAPDFVINGGGLVNVYFELSKEGYAPQPARNKVNEIYRKLSSIYTIAKQNGCSTIKAAMELAHHSLRYGVGKRKDPLYFPTEKTEKVLSSVR